MAVQVVEYIQSEDHKMAERQDNLMVDWSIEDSEGNLKLQGFVILPRVSTLLVDIAEPG